MTKTIIRTSKVQLAKESAHKYDLSSRGVIRSPEDAYDIFEQVFQTDCMTKEHFMLLTLNTKNKVIGAHVVHVGSINASVVHPREVFQLAVLENAASIVVAHNHPSGDTTPSQEDIHVTKRLKEAGTIMGIELLDHVILGERHLNLSLKEKGYV